MEKMISSQELVSELKAIRKDLDYIKEHMVEHDEILNEQDYEALRTYRKEKEEGSLTSHEDLKKELGI